MLSLDINTIALSKLTDLLANHTKELLNVMNQKGVDFSALNQMCLELKSIQAAIDTQNAILMYLV